MATNTNGFSIHEDVVRAAAEHQTVLSSAVKKMEDYALKASVGMLPEQFGIIANKAEIGAASSCVSVCKELLLFAAGDATQFMEALSNALLNTATAHSETEAKNKMILSKVAR